MSKLGVFSLYPELASQYLELDKEKDLWMKDPMKILVLGDSHREEPWIW